MTKNFPSPQLFVMSNAIIEQSLKARWDELNDWMIAEKRSLWWRKLNDSYSEPHRFYHTLKHIHHMFNNYDLYKDNLTNRVACAYAIFFHDLIYDPKHSDNNEKCSAEEFMIFCKETAVQDASLIANLIEMTRSQCTEAHLQRGVYGCDDAHYLLDFDMATLGSSDEGAIYSRMSNVRRSRKPPPEGWELIEPTLDEFAAKMREGKFLAQTDTHEGKRRTETLWPIFRIHHQRSKYIYDLFYKRQAISRELYEYCLNEKLADAALIAKWKKSGYENLCCLRCIQTKDTNFGTNCICRVPKTKLEEQGMDSGGRIVECVHCGCRGCSG
uniref:Protein BUD31 homolog n=1 Tax=Romanomermis culicivorax TaxID=13658 RepID=A0A915I3U1_ROMCU